MLRIAFVITRADTIGGAHMHVKDLARELRSLGIAVTIIVGGTGPYLQLLADEGIPYVSLRYLSRAIRPARDLIALVELRAALRTVRPNLVALHSSKAGLLGRIACRTLGLPATFTAHGWSFTEGVGSISRRVFQTLERTTSHLADRVITVSDYDQNLATQLRVMEKDKMVTVHNGMPDTGVKPTAKPDATPPRLIMVARLDKQKDHELLLNVLGNLREYRWELELLGDGDQRGRIQQLVCCLDIRDRVSILGFRSDVAERLEKAQVFVLTSHWEGFPLTILEAMRAGLPVIATDVGGVSEAVIHGETGLIVAPGNGTALAKALVRLIENPELRSKMGVAGRRRFESQFTFQQMLYKTLHVYAEVFKNRGHFELAENVRSITD